jgi:hypothetical protein
MGTEVAVPRGVGTVVLDVRHGDGSQSCFNYTEWDQEFESVLLQQRVCEPSVPLAAEPITPLACRPARDHFGKDGDGLVHAEERYL